MESSALGGNTRYKYKRDSCRGCSMQTGTVNFLLRHLLSSIMRPQRPSLSRHGRHSAGDQTHTENLKPEITHRPQNIKHWGFSIDDQSWILLELSKQSYSENHFYSCFKSRGSKVPLGFYRWRADRPVFFRFDHKEKWSRYWWEYWGSHRVIIETLELLNTVVLCTSTETNIY